MLLCTIFISNYNQIGALDDRFIRRLECIIIYPGLQEILNVFLYRNSEPFHRNSIQLMNCIL